MTQYKSREVSKLSKKMFKEKWRLWNKSLNNRENSPEAAEFICSSNYESDGRSKITHKYRRLGEWVIFIQHLEANCGVTRPASPIGIGTMNVTWTSGQTPNTSLLHCTMFLHHNSISMGFKVHPHHPHVKNQESSIDSFVFWKSISIFNSCICRTVTVTYNNHWTCGWYLEKHEDLCHQTDFSGHQCSWTNLREVSDLQLSNSWESLPPPQNRKPKTCG